MEAEEHMIADFGPVDSYHEGGSYPEVRSKTNVPLTSIPNMPPGIILREAHPARE